ADVSVVKLGAASVPFVVEDATHLHLTLADSALTNNLTATGPGGTSSPLKLPIAPTITTLGQTSGVAGTSFTITGKTFVGTTKVTFGSVSAPGPFTVLSNTQLKVTAPASAISGPITVTNAGGSTASATSFHVLPKLTSFSPAQAVAATTVTITGTGLSATTGVSFNGSPASSLLSSTATSVKATVPANATIGQIVVTTPGGSATSTASFKPVPKLTSTAPNPAHAGDTITVTGSNLADVSVVKLGAASVPFVVEDATHLHLTLADSALTNNLTATGPGGTSSPLKLPIAPTITTLGQTSGVAGTSFTITGKTFAGTTKVTFGSVSAPGPFTVLSNTQLKVTAPASAISGPITVTNAGGSTASATSFHVLPKLTSFSPAQAVAPPP